MSPNDYKILLVEDEEHMVAAIELLLSGTYAFRSATSAAEARKALQSSRADLLLLDLGLPDQSGLSLLKEMRQEGLHLDVVVITVSTDVTTAVEVMKLGALDYIQKPFEREDLLLCVQRAYQSWELRGEVDRLRSELYRPFHFSNIVAQSPQMLSVLSIARKMARSEATVLITGPSGTGKELVARAIHCDGTRSDGPFVPVNCAQFSGSLLESELFGHEKGAFTGATGTRKGRFELADGGTIFLDEVGNTSPEMQAKILRVVENKRFERVGAEQSIDVDVRVIAATNTDLEEAVRAGSFREDLYYRLNVVRIELPPLRERKEDIEPLCKHFLAKCCVKTGRSFAGITPEALSLLQSYDWQGNVRELQNLLEMTVALEDTEWITTRYFPQHVRASAIRKAAGTGKAQSLLYEVMQDLERQFLREQLRVHGWNHRRTAKALGVHRNTLENRMRKYGLREDEQGEA